MATTSVHFEPTIQNFGDLNLRATHAQAAAWKSGISTEQRRALVNFLAGFVFILGFITLLSALYVADQSVFEQPNIATASQPAVNANGALVDYD